jgi:hypothetical protein
MMVIQIFKKLKNRIGDLRKYYETIYREQRWCHGKKKIDKLIDKQIARDNAKNKEKDNKTNLEKDC